MGNQKQYRVWLIAAALGIGVVSGCGTGKVSQTKEAQSMTTEYQMDNEASIEDLAAGHLTEEVSCHDPQIIVGEDGRYYMFGSHIVAAESDNLWGWSYLQTGTICLIISTMVICLRFLLWGKIQTAVTPSGHRMSATMRQWENM